MSAADKQEMSKLHPPFQASDMQNRIGAYKLMGIHPREATLKKRRDRFRKIMRFTHPDVVPRYTKRLAHSLCKNYVGGDNRSVQGKPQLSLALGKRFDWYNKVLLELLSKIQTAGDSSPHSSSQNRARQNR